MADQDHDGSHIKGLIINFIHCYWPALLKHHDFVREFVTPIVKVSKARPSLSFQPLTLTPNPNPDPDPDPNPDPDPDPDPAPDQARHSLSFFTLKEYANW